MVSAHKCVHVLSVSVAVESLLDILTCHSRKSTSGINNNYHGCFLFSVSSFLAPAGVYAAESHGLVGHWRNYHSLSECLLSPVPGT